MNRVLIIIATLIISGCSTDSAEILSIGIVNNETISTEQNKNLVSGVIHIIDSWNLVKSTSDIPNKLGIEFGMAYTVTSPFSSNLSEVQEVMVFPGDGLTNPTTGQSVKEESESVVVISGEEQYFSYTFDAPWEVKSGEWVFQVKQKGKVLLEQVFVVQ